MNMSNKLISILNNINKTLDDFPIYTDINIESENYINFSKNWSCLPNVEKCNLVKTLNETDQDLLDVLTLCELNYCDRDVEYEGGDATLYISESDPKFTIFNITRLTDYLNIDYVYQHNLASLDSEMQDQVLMFLVAYVESPAFTIELRELDDLFVYGGKQIVEYLSLYGDTKSEASICFYIMSFIDWITLPENDDSFYNSYDNQGQYINKILNIINSCDYCDYKIILENTRYSKNYTIEIEQSYFKGLIEHDQRNDFLSGQELCRFLYKYYIDGKSRDEIHDTIFNYDHLFNSDVPFSTKQLYKIIRYIYTNNCNMGF